MKLEDIIKLMEAAQKSGFDSLELEQDEFYIKLDKNKAPQQIMPQMHINAPAHAQFQVPAIQEMQVAQAEEEAPKAPGTKDISSPLVGIFHELSGGKAVKIGDRLAKGDVVCMVEAMKLMNELHMPEGGEITWVAVDEGDTVEFEQLLFSYVK